MTKATQDKTVSSTVYRFRLRDFLLGAQMLFVAFGALVLVPILAGLDPQCGFVHLWIRNFVFSNGYGR